MHMQSSLLLVKKESQILLLIHISEKWVRMEETPQMLDTGSVFMMLVK